jgi:hypothetical protein
MICEKIKLGKKLHSHQYLGEILNLCLYLSGFRCPSDLLMDRLNLA